MLCMDSRLVALASDRASVLPLRSPVPIPLAALVVDLDHVLYDASPWQRWLLQLLNRIGLHTHYQCFFRTFERDYLDGVYRGERDYWEALRDYLMAVGVSKGRTAEVLAAAHGKHRELWQDVRPLPGVSATLAQLAARGVRLAVLSNSPESATAIEQKLQRLGIAGRFEIVLSSRDLRVAKPMPECYQAALRALDLQSDDVGFIAHETLELAGAGLAGMTTFAINHAADAEADVFLDRFEQLLSHVLPVTLAKQRVG
jgi:HAD superfamily hydrolase (TIGR01493 family)